MGKAIRKRSGWWVALPWMLVLSLSHAAGTGQGKNSGGSLLPECQGAQALPSVHCGQVPTPAFDADGRLWLAFVQHGHVYVTHSDDLGASFTPPVVVNRIPEVIYSDGENRPKLVLGAQGDLYLSWTRKIEGRHAGDVRFARSLDGGESFSTPVTVNSDRAPISHRFETMVLDGQGRIYIAWIDKRDLEAARQAGEAYAGAAIYYAMSDDRGASFAFNRKLVDHVCECCRLAMAADTDDRIITLWRHIYPVNIRDHAIARWRLADPPISGLPTRATRDEWQVEGCPHHGPDLSLGTQQKVHLAWFTQGKNSQGLMYGRFDLASGKLDYQQPIASSGSAARPQVLALADQVLTAWKSFNGVTTELWLNTSSDQGESWATPRVVAHTADGSDYPMLLTHDGKSFVSWHTLAEGYRLIPLDDTTRQVKHDQ